MKKILLLAAVLSAPLSADARESINHKLLNLRFEPHWLLLTELTLDFQFRVSRHWSVGPTLAYMVAGSGIFYGNQTADRFFYDERTSRPTFGIRGVYYVTGVDHHSLYLAGVTKHSISNVTSKPDADVLSDELEREGSFSETSFAITVGYQWVVGPVTFNAGAGPAYYIHPENFTVRSTGGDEQSYSLANAKFGYFLDAGMGFRF